MNVQQKLNEYYANSPFANDGGLSKDTASVYAGPYLIQIPNTDKRKELIPYHDLHHMFAGYDNSRIGEGEIGAWELATNCWKKPLAVFYNLAGMSTGLLYSRRRIYKAFMSGCSCRNLYGLENAKLLNSEVAELESYVFCKTGKGKNWFVNFSRFLFYFIAAIVFLPINFVIGYVYSRR